jgi:alkanesulfonate monooxygenase SsuD/methylene tetrahydromethanopterin reductase-like flavin-dependent oxidoreductase (luciferase family)
MTAAATGLQAQRLALYSRNALKIGFFGPNCSSGIAATKVPERWSGSWEDNLRLARMLDDAGIEFILPVARWKGWGGETNFEGHTFETITWACGLLAATKTITVFGTVHAPLVHPVFAAKQFVTVDHVSRGRFGLNVVCGWNQDEFDMFGLSQREHDDRYAHGSEWLDVIQRLWSDSAPADFDGAYFHLHDLEAEPKPYGGTRPVVMNAGASPAGKAFALARADCLFTPLRTLEQGAESVAALKAEARALGRDVDVYTNVHIICRPTTAEAQAYYHWFADENADWGAVEHMHNIGTRHSSTSHQDGAYERMKVRFAAGYGGYPLVGDPDTVAAEIARVSAAGFTGFSAGLVNYLDEFPYLQAELLPRLERLGLRTAERKTA